MIKGYFLRTSWENHLSMEIFWGYEKTGEMDMRENVGNV
jgi:hypothetical protein